MSSSLVEPGRYGYCTYKTRKSYSFVIGQLPCWMFCYYCQKWCVHLWIGGIQGPVIKFLQIFWIIYSQINSLVPHLGNPPPLPRQVWEILARHWIVHLVCYCTPVTVLTSACISLLIAETSQGDPGGDDEVPQRWLHKVPPEHPTGQHVRVQQTNAALWVTEEFYFNPSPSRSKKKRNRVILFAPGFVFARNICALEPHTICLCCKPY